MTAHFPLEPLHARAIGKQMPPTLAIMVLIGPHTGLIEALGELYPQSQTKKLYFIEDPVGNQLLGILQEAEQVGIPCIVLGGGEVPSPLGIPSCNHLARFSLISNGSTYSESFLNSLIPETAPINYFSWLGFQNYHTNPEILSALQARFFETMRLGTLRQNIQNAEPLLREAAHHFIDFRCVRSADAPDGLTPSPNGLYAEELCTLARYIGLSPRLCSCFLYGYPQTAGKDTQIMQLLAQTLWHLTEGISVALPEYPDKEEATLEKKMVQLGEDGGEIFFIHSIQSGRWWMEVPNFKGISASSFISCSIDDYLTACKGEVPTKWLFFYQKSNNF